MTNLSGMDIVGVLGLLVSIAGFAIAIWQIWKTKAAAEAARDSAAEAVDGVRKMYAVSTLQDIAGRSRNLLNLIKSKNLAAAAAAAFELRDAVSKYQPSSKESASETTLWTKVREEVDSLHERLESIAVANRWTADEREALIHRTSRLHTQLAANASRLVSTVSTVP
ncbi:hypothetical protein [Acidovorax sp. NB1]|uniref:hypothetical protein n=1 Tax=Acidovorax sp. NB1 TaxID=1943571 RepID=UPI0010EAB2F2|nr:hypothetical protein [Acidovorax sp. NB1]GDY35485.1 hypothetical protein ACINB_13770 [Acidovorax sp. NB1]